MTESHNWKDFGDCRGLSSSSIQKPCGISGTFRVVHLCVVLSTVTSKSKI